MSDAFRQELRKFDAQRVLPAWDGLVAKQQARLEALGVPAMFPTTAKSDREVSPAGWTMVLGCYLTRIVAPAEGYPSASGYRRERRLMTLSFGEGPGHSLCSSPVSQKPLQCLLRVDAVLHRPREVSGDGSHASSLSPVLISQDVYAVEDEAPIPTRSDEGNDTHYAISGALLISPVSSGFYLDHRKTPCVDACLCGLLQGLTRLAIHFPEGMSDHVGIIWT